MQRALPRPDGIWLPRAARVRAKSMTVSKGHGNFCIVSERPKNTEYC